MVQGFSVTIPNIGLNNLYALILAGLGLIEPSQAWKGDEVILDMLSNLQLLMPLSNSTNSGKTISVQDLKGREITSLLPGIPFIINGTANEINLREFQVHSDTIGTSIDVSATSR